ncbi:MAG: hypothetical protein QXS85_03930 [Acidilobaceae archaeon]
MSCEADSCAYKLARALIAVALIAVVLFSASAGVFAYRHVDGLAAVAHPVVWFESPPASSGVIARIGPYGISALVEASAGSRSPSYRLLDVYSNMSTGFTSMLRLSSATPVECAGLTPGLPANYALSHFNTTISLRSRTGATTTTNIVITRGQVVSSSTSPLSEAPPPAWSVKWHAFSLIGGFEMAYGTRCMVRLDYVWWVQTPGVSAFYPVVLNITSPVVGLREHDVYVRTDWNPDIRFSMADDRDIGRRVLEIDSYSAGARSMGQGAVLIVVPRDLLHGNVLEITWRGYFTFEGAREIGRVSVADSVLSRDQAFPTNDRRIEENYRHVVVLQYTSPERQTGWYDWRTNRATVDLSGFTSEYVTIVASLVDAWIGQSVALRIASIRVLTPGGAVLAEWVFDDRAEVVMERTGTVADFGHVRRPRLT